MQRAIIASVQFEEIIGLQNHVVEFQKAQRLLALEAQFHAVETHHAIDRKMAAIVAQKLDVIELGKPVVIIDHNGIRGAIAESEEALESGADSLLILVDFFLRQQLPAFVFARGVADFRGAAANDHDGSVACLLQAAQHEDGN